MEGCVWKPRRVEGVFRYRKQVANLNQSMVEQWFSQEKYKLKLEATNKQAWKNMNLDQRRTTVADSLTKTIEQEAQRPNFFISRGSDRFPPFVKLTFAAVEDKFLFEKSLKNLRLAAKDQKHKPSFMSYRMTPAQFEPIKKDLLEAARAKLTEDFIEKVKKSNTNTDAESSTYNTDYDTIRQCWY